MKQPTPTAVKRYRPKKKPQSQSIVVNDIRVQSADRSRKDIQSFKFALIGAEAVTNPNRTRLYDLYEDITLDGFLTGLIEKRIAKVINKTLYFQDAQGKHVEELDKLIDSNEFREAMKRVLESKFWGLSGLEFLPGEKFAFKDIPRKHIKPHLKIISDMQSGQTGIDYEDAFNLWIVGHEKDLGLLLKCSPYAIWKRGALADYSQYIEIFGQPVRIVKYDAYDTKTQSELKKVLDESGSSLALMIPKQADFEMMDGKTANATGELQDRFRIAANQEMSVLMLGASESTVSSDTSGYAQAETHQAEEGEIINSDLKFLRAMLNSDFFINILRSYGYPVDGGEFLHEKETNLAELKLRLDIDQIATTKVPVADDYWYDTYGLPKPDNYEQLKQEMELKKKAQEVDFEEVEEEEHDPKKPNPKKQPKTKVKLSQLQQLRAYLADFFDQAR